MCCQVQRLTQILKLVSGPSKMYVNWMPQKIRVVSAGEGNCVCELTVDEDLVNVNNVLHGGCTATIVDMVSSLALMASKNPFPGVSVELGVSYMAAAKLGDEIVIDAKIVKLGQNLAFLHADIRRKSDGAVVAVGKHTQYVGQLGGGVQNAIHILKNM